MLHGSQQSSGVHALNVCLCQTRPKVWVLPGNVLKVPAVPRHPVHLHGGPQNHVDALGGKLIRHRCGKCTHNLRVPCGSHGQSRGPTCNGTNKLGPHGAESPCRILHVQAWDPKTRDRGDIACVPPFLGIVHDPASALHQVVLLLGSHLSEQSTGLLVGLLPRERLKVLGLTHRSVLLAATGRVLGHLKVLPLLKLTPQERWYPLR
mmetsp:Transcript_56651/g.165716  ORF Transcript_56651/g.165716 Transcript_56651/m.165716 type:complete len:206 (+) Transcript_56651:1674-2291(+)